MPGTREGAVSASFPAPSSDSGSVEQLAFTLLPGLGSRTTLESLGCSNKVKPGEGPGRRLVDTLRGDDFFFFFLADWGLPLWPYYLSVASSLRFPDAGLALQ